MGDIRHSMPCRPHKLIYLLMVSSLLVALPCSGLYALAPESQLEEIVLQAYETGDVSQKLWALDRMGWMKSGPRARALLYAALQDSEPLVRGRAAEVFGLWGEEEGADNVVPLLRDPSETVRLFTQEALRKVGGSQATTALQEYTSFYLSPEQIAQERKKASELRRQVEERWRSSASYAEIKGLAHACLTTLERLVVALEYDADVMDEYHAAHRWWEGIRHERGWDENQYHFLVVIPTMNRPESLRRLLNSLVEELEAFGYGGREGVVWRKIRVLVVDDSDDIQNAHANTQVIRDMRRAGLRIDYWSEMRQKRFLFTMHEKYPSAPFERFIKKSDEALQHPQQHVFALKGYAGARNTTLLAAALTLRGMPKRSLVLSLDDDGQIGKRIQQGLSDTQEHFISYFHLADEIFAQNSNIQVAGGGHTGAPNLNAEVLVEALTGINTLLATAAKVRPQTPYHQEPLGGFRMSRGELAGTFGEALTLFLSSLAGFDIGKFPNVLAVYDPKKKLAGTGDYLPELQPVKSLPGGNLILRPAVVYWGLPFMDMPRGEDTLFSETIGLLRYDSVYAVEGLSVVHDRSDGGRPSFVEELEKSYTGGQLLACIFVPLTPSLRRMSKSGELEGTERLRKAVREHPAFKEGEISGQKGAMRTSLRDAWQDQFDPVSAARKALEKYLNPSRPEYWWNHSEALKESVGVLRDLLESLKALERTQQAEDAYSESGANAVADYMYNFVETVGAIPVWEKIMREIADGTLREEGVGAVSGSLDDEERQTQIFATAL